MRKWNYENEQWTQLPSHLKHLPLFTRSFDIFSFFVRILWAIILKFFFRFYIRLKVYGDFKQLYLKYPKLLIISNHASHLDAVSIAAAIPFIYWLDLFIAAAKDYFFTNPLFTFFSQHCLGAIPIDRGDKKGRAIGLCIKLLESLERIWLILFPEGTRSRDGRVQSFKRGVSVFALKTNTPILFIYLKGNLDLWPKGALFAKPGKLEIYIGPVIPPGDVDQVYLDFKKWVLSIDSKAEFAE